MRNEVNLTDHKVVSVNFQNQTGSQLNGLDWDNIPASLVIITGDNGAGKTLLLNAIERELKHSSSQQALNYVYVKHNYYPSSSSIEISEAVTSIAMELFRSGYNTASTYYRYISGSLDFNFESNKKLPIEKIREELVKLGKNDDWEVHQIINTSIAICIRLPPIPSDGLYSSSSPMTVFQFRCKYFFDIKRLIKNTDFLALRLVFSDIWERIENVNKGMNILELDRLFRKNLIEFIFKSTNPVDEINSHLKKNKFPYIISYKYPDQAESGNVELVIRNPQSKREISFDALSSGEKVILTIFSWKFMAFENGLTHKTSVVLLDEADKHFGPNLMELYQKTLRRVFVEKGVQVIMSTHRPDMVALANDTELFMLQRKNQRCTIKPCNRLLALSRLTRNLSSFYNVTTSVFTEGFDDANFYNAIYDVLKRMAYSIRQESRSFFEYDLSLLTYSQLLSCEPQPGNLYVTSTGFYRLHIPGKTAKNLYLFLHNSPNMDRLNNLRKQLSTWDGRENSMIKNGILNIVVMQLFTQEQTQLKQLSFRYQMQFRAATDQEGKSGDWSNVARVVIRTSNEVIPGTHARERSASGINTPRFNFKLFRHYQVDGTFGLVDNDNQDRESMFKKMKTAIDPKIADKRIVSLERHSLENFHFDLVTLCSLFNRTVYNGHLSISLIECMAAVKNIFQKLRESKLVPDSEINNALDLMYREAFQQCAAYDPYLVLRKQLTEKILQKRISNATYTEDEINAAASILLDVLKDITDRYFFIFYTARDAYENSKTQEDEEAISQVKNLSEFSVDLKSTEKAFNINKKTNFLLRFNLITEIENIMKKEKLLDVKSLPVIDEIKKELENNFKNGVQYDGRVPYHYMNTKNQACIIAVPYPKLFKTLRGHDFEHMLIDYENRNRFKESILKQIENMAQGEQELSLFIPNDLVKSFLDLNARVKTQWVSKADPIKYASLTPEEMVTKGYYQTPQATLTP